jgi:hypothetical protein
MFNERVLEFKVGACTPSFKGVQLKNYTEINEQQRLCRCMIPVALGHCDKCAQRTESTNIGMEPLPSNPGRRGHALANPAASAYFPSP